MEATLQHMLHSASHFVVSPANALPAWPEDRAGEEAAQASGGGASLGAWPEDRAGKEAAQASCGVVLSRSESWP